MPLLDQRLFLKYASTHLDDLILMATFEELSASYSVPAHHILFEGRCRNLSSVQSSNKLQRSEYSFLCLHRLCDLHSRETDDDESSEKRPDPIIRLSSLSDLQAPFSAVAASDLLSELSRRYRPNPHDILVIFCADSVHDSLHFSAAQMSIILVSHSSIRSLIIHTDECQVDRISHSQLEYIAHRYGMFAFDTSPELLRYLKEQEEEEKYGHLPQSSRLILMSVRLIVSSFQYLEKISLGRGDPILRLVGGSKVSRRSTEPTQLVIRGCSSVTVGGMYKRLLRRCLTSLTAALNSGRYAPQDSSPDGSPSGQNSRGPYEVLCCAGCGISELAWAILFEEIVISLASPSTASRGNSNPFSELIAAVAQKLEAGLSRIAPGNGHSHLLQSSSLATLCHHLSQSYLEIPTLLLSNQHRAGKSFPVKRELLLWKQNLRGILFGELSWHDTPLPPHCFAREPFQDNEAQEVMVLSLGEAFFDGPPSSLSPLLVSPPH
jgi:hypothetical protein